MNVNSTPSAPIVGTIIQPTCFISTGSITLNGLPSTGDWTITRYPGGLTTTGNGTSAVVSAVLPGTYTFTVTNSSGCVSPSSGNAVIKPQPVTPAAPLVGTITAPTCTVSTGSVLLNGLPASGTWTLTRYSGAVTTTGTGTSTTITLLATGTYNYTVTNADGCISGLSANVVIPVQPETPSAPIIGAITHPSCSVATGSVVLSNLPAGNWIINPGSISGSTSSTIVTGLSSGTHSFTVTNAAGCTSALSANVDINAQPATPSAPVIGTISHPTCSVATGSVILSSLPSTGTWTLTRNPGGTTTSGTGTSTIISGLAAGTYTYTVTNSVGCTSAASANVVINSQPVSPATPLQSVDCTLGPGSAVVTVTSPTGSGLSYSLDGGSFQTSTIFNGVANNNHFIAVRNTAGCTTIGAFFTVSCGCLNPPTVTLGSVSGSTCGTEAITVDGNTFGGGATSVTITENGSGSVSQSTVNTSPFTFTYIPAAADANKVVTITITTNNPFGTPCIAAVANYTLTVNGNPAAPVVGTIIHPTCLSDTGSVTLGNLPSTGTWTLNRTPAGQIVTGTGTSTTISGLTKGTYNFKVTNAAGCTSIASANVVINPQPSTPATPVIGNVIQPTCALLTGSVVLSGLPSTGNWTVTRYPDLITKTGSGATTTISAIISGTYTFTVTNASGCMSNASDELIINAQPATPSAPSVGTITPPACSVSTGSVALMGLPSTGTWTLTRYPGAVAITGTGTNTIIHELPTGTYNYSVTSAAGCTSVLSANILIPSQPATPSAPVVGLVTQPDFLVQTGSVELSGLPGNGIWTLIRYPGDVTTSGTGIKTTIFDLLPGTYSFAVTNPAGCISDTSSVVTINAVPGDPVLIITNPATVCFPATVDLTASEVTTGSDPNLTYTYWENEAATIPYNNPAVSTAGTYYIKATTTAGFSTVKPVIVTADQRPIADAGPDQSLDYVFVTNLDAKLDFGTGVWSKVSGSYEFSDPSDPKTSVKELSLGANVIQWTVTNGVCPPVSDQVYITVNNLVIPTLITPNMDGLNDYFVLRGIMTLGKTELTIFNRKGVVVFKNQDYDNLWNGVDNDGNELSDDTYFYILKTLNGKSLSGYIVIRR